MNRNETNLSESRLSDGDSIVKDGKTATNTRSNSHVKDIVYIAMFTALIAVCSQIAINTGVIIFTMQTFAIFLAGSMLGAKRGTVSVLVYILIGMIGVPVFAQASGGPEALFGMTGGYIIGFIFTAFIVGLMCDKLGKRLWVLIVSMVIGLAVCYAFGTAWFIMVYSGKVEPINFSSALGLCVFPYLPFDALKIAAAALITERVSKIIRI